MRIPLKISGFRLQFADSTNNCGLRDSLSLLHIVLLFVLGFHKLVPDFTHFVADSAKLPVFGAILNNTVFQIFVRGIQDNRDDHREIVTLRIPRQI